MPTLRKYLIAGLLVWLPLAATVVLIRLVIGLLDGIVLLLPPEFRPQALLGVSIPGMGLVLAIAILLLTGMLAANILGRRLVALWEAILGRIPLVRTIYNAVKQISATILDSEGKSFRKVVMVEYPKDGIWSIGFLTNREVDVQTGEIGEEMTAVFVPTTPNPTSGFIVLLPAGKVFELDMSVEEGIKFVISMGVIVPEGPLRGSLPAGAVAQSAADS
ncbi:MAG: DUF502 domain-containing protein [Gammaproteobacteria bacterium]|jgi:uncharacterized membrane protein